MEKNFLFINEEKLDKPIYRIFPIHRFLEILDTNKLTLLKPKLWDDPFENALLSSTFIISGEKTSIAARNSVYAQCWTWLRESDAMWRIYSPNKDGIRVSTTPRKLLNSLHGQVGEFAKVRGFIGQVKYFKKSELIDKLKEINLLKTDGSGIAESLLYKREAFQHEDEIRLIYFGRDKLCQYDTFKFDINPIELFDILLFDPRINPYLKKAYKDHIIKKGRFKFRRSSLYEAPKGLTFKLSE
ncbi:DUF2971 domain-containing protein [Eikenella sp. S3360]|uniref:DUF2971 domain-containing protein n=1 Tax=Eikenella glucosivorans TaxID=2766967 RepID=A0ABS0N6Y4_9NEIS|nr:DUF2971 domain-containing protein [Eikenella glucosivorans]MBH5328062.1 DUF2971 domain-containing protein [Eikenella glucosivorans]